VTSEILKASYLHSLKEQKLVEKDTKGRRKKSVLKDLVLLLLNSSEDFCSCLQWEHDLTLRVLSY